MSSSLPPWMDHTLLFWSAQPKSLGTLVDCFLGGFGAFHLLQQNHVNVWYKVQGWLLTTESYVPFMSSVFTTVAPLQAGGIQGAILWASIFIGAAAENSEASTIFSSTDLHQPSISTSPVKSWGLLSGHTNWVRNRHHAWMIIVLQYWLLHVSTMYCTCCFFSGVQFLQFPSPLSKMGAMPQIPHIPAFQSLAVMASKAKYPS